MTGTIMNVKESTLPEFAFVEGSWHEKGGDPLEGRIVILHVRSASVIEIFDREDVALNDNVLTYKFSYSNSLGIKEPMIAALHYCATLDSKADREFIKAEIMKPAAQWYCDYCAWEDDNIIKEGNER